MKEEILNFIWKHSYFSFNAKATVDGDILEIINPGDYNSDSGPDFFNAKLRLNQTIWAGNVEVHLNSSDWYRHEHHVNPAFDNVILHVVVNDDKPAVSSKGRRIPTLVISYPDSLEWNLMHLTESNYWIPCADIFKSYDPLAKSMWLSNLMVERLEQKTKQVKALVDQLNGSWEEAFYISLARSFGLKVNALPFEMLAKSLPLKVLGKHKNNLLQLESLLFGQSGLITIDSVNDGYSKTLLKEYQFLQRKFSLKPIDGSLWKHLRMRPSAFPEIRIALFAMLIHKSSSLYSKILEASSSNDILKLLSVEVSDYWKTHYSLGQESRMVEKHLGVDAVHVIMLNTIIPFIYAYGIARENESLKEKALAFLETLKPESNSIVRGFANLGLKPLSAFDTQAMIHLKTNYCDPKKCLFCHLGAGLLLKSVN